MANNQRAVMLKRVQVAEFAMHDTALFLDTHPSNTEALAYMQKNQKLHETAVNEYTAAYGPLTHHQMTNPECWDWIKGPWPWQMDCEV